MRAVCTVKLKFPISDFKKKLILNLKKSWCLADIRNFEVAIDLNTTNDDYIYVEHFFLTYPGPKILKIEWFEPKIWPKYWQCICPKNHVFLENAKYFLSVIITLFLLLYYTVFTLLYFIYFIILYLHYYTLLHLITKSTN